MTAKNRVIGILMALTLLLGTVFVPINTTFGVLAAESVTYTFKDTLNEIDYPVTVQKGDSIAFPADPVDNSNQQWFMGWYTDEACTTEFTDTVFGEEDKTLYSCFKGEIPEFSQNFDDYKGVTAVDGSGAPVVIDAFTLKGGKKNNRFYFSKIFTKTNTVTYNNSAYSIKMDWDKNMTAAEPDRIAASTQYRKRDMYMWIGIGLKNKENYIVTFKYYIEKADTDIRFYLASAASNNINTDVTEYGMNNDTTGFRASKAKAGQGWQEGSISFTANLVNEASSTLYLGMTLASNQNVTVYVDEVSVKAAVQPYESAVSTENH